MSKPPAQTQSHTSYTSKPAPGPRGNLLLGSFIELQRGQVRFYLETWRKYGDLARFRIGPLVAHIIVHPNHVRHVLAHNRHNYGKGPGYARTRDFLGLGLLTSEGEVWQKQRRLMQPPFTAKEVAAFARDMTEATEAMLARWDAVAERGEALDIQHEMVRLTLSIIGKTMLSTEVGAESAVMVQAYADACEFINRRLASFIDLPLFLPTSFNRRFTAALRTLDRLIYQIIMERQDQPNGAKNDLLAKLLAARDETTDEGMSLKQLRDEVITIFFAGHETSAEALTWAWYLLAQHPEVEHTLHAELDTVLGGRTPTSEDLARLPYTRMVMEETMRLYPPVWTFPRAALEADEIGGYHIPAGSLIFPCQYLTHRHPDFWDQPEAFDPSRFTLERSAERPTYAYYPFGGGPRTCIGLHFALQEMCLVLATVAQRYRLHLATDSPIEPKSVITLHPSQPVLMTLEHRS